jgi:hypothetical protein
MDISSDVRGKRSYNDEFSEEGQQLKRGRHISSKSTNKGNSRSEAIKQKREMERRNNPAIRSSRGPEMPVSDHALELTTGISAKKPENDSGAPVVSSFSASSSNTVGLEDNIDFDEPEEKEDKEDSAESSEEEKTVTTATTSPIDIINFDEEEEDSPIQSCELSSSDAVYVVCRNIDLINSKDLFRLIKGLSVSQRDSLVAMISSVRKSAITDVNFDNLDKVYPRGALWPQISDAVVKSISSVISDYGELYNFIYGVVMPYASVDDKGNISVRDTVIIVMGSCRFEFHLKKEFFVIAKEVFRKTVKESANNVTWKTLVPLYSNGTMKYDTVNWVFNLHALPVGTEISFNKFIVSTRIAAQRDKLKRTIYKTSTPNSYAGACSAVNPQILAYSASVKANLEKFYAVINDKGWLQKNFYNILGGVMSMSANNKAWRAQVQCKDEYLKTPEFDYYFKEINAYTRRDRRKFYGEWKNDVSAEDPTMCYDWSSRRPSEVTVLKFKYIKFNYSSDKKVLKEWANKLNGVVSRISYVQAHSMDILVTYGDAGYNKDAIYKHLANQGIRIWRGEIRYMIAMVSGDFTYLSDNHMSYKSTLNTDDKIENDEALFLGDDFDF